MSATRIPAPSPALLPDDNPCAACTIRERAICAVLSDAELRTLAETTRTERTAAHETLFYEGDQSDALYVVKEGSLKLYKLLPDGRRQVTGFLFDGDLLGLAYRDTHEFTAEALEDTEVCRMPRGRLEPFATEVPALGQRLLAQASSGLASAQEQMLLLGRKTAQERIASFLLWLRQRAIQRGRSADLIRLPMSRSDIGDYLGLTVETVSRVITQLKKTGTIELVERNLVRLADTERLTELAGSGEGLED